MTDDAAKLAERVGRRESAEDVIAPGPAARLAAMLWAEGPDGAVAMRGTVTLGDGE